MKETRRRTPSGAIGVNGMDTKGWPTMTNSLRTETLGQVGGEQRRGWRDSAGRYALLPLRVFLGVTFIYAAVDKFTTPGFFGSSSPSSVGQTIRAVRDSAAIPQMVDLALKSPTGFGYAIALGELAVGIGILFGIIGRLAATGGALISLSLWLTVSWSTTPYYYGNDLIYLMAMLPFIIGGTPLFSADAIWANRRRMR
jgi:thiosulfate dehydrogenase [quinone] large subunit